MIWVAWRQHRTQIIAGGLFLAVLAAFFLISGFEISSRFTSSGLAACLPTHAPGCDRIAGAFNDHYRGLRFLIPLFLVLPAFMGVFWGAPVVAREIEQGTHRLAWTQGVTRRRWIVTKIGVLTLAAVAWAAVFSYLLSWWSRPLIAVQENRFDPGIFDLRGIVPIAYVLFALALGIAAGTVIRRAVPAMAATFLGFGVVRAVIALVARHSYVAAKTISYAFPFSSGKVDNRPLVTRGAWTVSQTTLDRAGHFMGNGVTLQFPMLSPQCPALQPSAGKFPSPEVLDSCIQRIGLHVREVYQPGSRYWLFQGIESAIFLALAASLLVLTVWWVRRRVH